MPHWWTLIRIKPRRGGKVRFQKIDHRVECFKQAISQADLGRYSRICALPDYAQPTTGNQAKRDCRNAAYVR